MSRQAFRVVFVNASCAYISGHGSREVLLELKGRAPVWSSLGRAWVVQPATASDFIAVVERRGYVVDVLEDDPLPAARGLLW